MANHSMFTPAAVAADTASMMRSTMKPEFGAETQTRTTYGKSVVTKVERELIRISRDTALAMRYVRNARLKIFDGLPGKARVFTTAAVTQIDAALADSEVRVLDIREPSNNLKEGEQYVPFIANLAIVEDITLNDAKTQHIGKANSYLHKGEPRKALQELQLGKIDVVLTSEMVPLNMARSRIANAASLIEEGKYFEANLALKAVEDSVVIETFGIDEIPKTRSISVSAASG